MAQKKTNVNYIIKKRCIDTKGNDHDKDEGDYCHCNCDIDTTDTDSDDGIPMSSPEVLEDEIKTIVNTVKLMPATITVNLDVIWDLVGDKALPYTYRDGVQYCSQDMAKHNLVRRYGSIDPAKLNVKIIISTFRMTACEAMIYTRINNVFFCDSGFKKLTFTTDHCVAPLKTIKMLDVLLARIDKSK